MVSDVVKRHFIISTIVATGKHTRKLLRRYPIDLGQQYQHVCDLKKLALGVYFGDGKYKNDSASARRQVVEANFNEVLFFVTILVAMEKNTYKPSWRERWKHQDFAGVANWAHCPSKPQNLPNVYPWFMEDPHTFTLQQIVDNW